MTFVMSKQVFRLSPIHTASPRLTAEHVARCHRAHRAPGARSQACGQVQRGVSWLARGRGAMVVYGSRTCPSRQQRGTESSAIHRISLTGDRGEAGTVAKRIVEVTQGRCRFLLSKLHGADGATR